ncbi:hypothetical protein [Streptomyces rubellomurinus]|uniref:BMP family ABC transporter substrate-binding protein n=1 Tax=Streptomyces rubellomurinus (strain ATCC 31215) TaxID=359131 RepID=A0A0F2T733_STRR3|nr:hypothetical protein [Streptomyces rubellomurinus]KJS58231.1 hypothetical protein VM95_34690 [Streptomyces rubellomurinus]
MMFPTSPHVRWALGLVSALTVATVVALLTLGTDDTADNRPAPVTPSNIAGRRTACLTGDTTEAGNRTDTSTIWAALQEASQQGQLNVQQLFPAATTADQALPYLAGLAAQHCDLIVAVGPTFGQALNAAAKANPHTSFVAVTVEGQPSPAGVATITGSDTDKAAEVRRQALALPSPGH